MALPTSRNTTYAPLSQVQSADLNDLQDKIVALNNLVTATAQAIWTGITLAANQHLTLSGTGKLKHGTQTLSLGAGAFQPNATAMSYTRVGGGMSYGTGAAWSGIKLPIGARISAVRAHVLDSATGPTKMDLQLWRVAAGIATALATSAQSLGNATENAVAITGLAVDIEATKFYQLVVSVATGSASCTLRGAEIDWSMP